MVKNETVIYCVNSECTLRMPICYCPAAPLNLLDVAVPTVVSDNGINSGTVFANNLAASR